MTNSNSSPLYERLEHKNTMHKVMEFIILFLLLSLLVYRLLSFSNHGFAWLVAFLCELWFTLYWVITISNKWSFVEYKTYPDRLLQRVAEHELPPVDMFVTTADSELEPPIITINTVLSLLAVDYPTDKLACYVSDDGCSPLTFYSLVEASKFAKLWVPFCKKYNVQVRAPFRYFNNDAIPSSNNSGEFMQEWKTMKIVARFKPSALSRLSWTFERPISRDEYMQLNRKIEDAVGKSIPFDLSEDFSLFSNIERNNHPTIIKVVLDKEEGHSNELPHLVYISREKRPKHPHHSKAGAMNVLTRVSGLMTNALFMLNVDCDMFANNPSVVLHAMCILLGSNENQNEIAFAQFPQIFYDGLKDDPFGNQMAVIWKYMGHGIQGIQGVFYAGTGRFHRRQVIYGLSPNNVKFGERNLEKADGKLGNQELLKTFGNSKDLTKSAADALRGETKCPSMLLKSIEAAAYQVASCEYEYGTNWGRKVGWMYGSTTEDILTGLSIHNRGWKSIICTPDQPAFLGCTPTGGPASMTQQKRWATGLLEVLLSKNCPIFGTVFAHLQFRQCLAYFWIFTWGLRSLPETCYAALPAYSIITNTHIFPKGQELAYYIPIALFVTTNIYNISQYIQSGLSIRAWWNNQKMGRITTMSAWLFGVFGIVLKLSGISETVFEVTKKDQSSSTEKGTEEEDTEAGRFTFDKSPMFVPPTTVLLLHLTALASALFGQQPPAHDGLGSGRLEVAGSVCLVLCLWPFLKGLFGSGKYGIPLSTIFKSAGLTLVFCTLCRS